MNVEVQNLAAGSLSRLLVTIDADEGRPILLPESPASCWTVSREGPGTAKPASGLALATNCWRRAFSQRGGLLKGAFRPSWRFHNSDPQQSLPRDAVDASSKCRGSRSLLPFPPGAG